MIAIVDYGLGNLRSIRNMLHRVGVESVITHDASELRRASKLLLPGVGHFGFAMESLRARGLVDELNELVLGKKTPVLGICLGAQLLGRGSEEADTPGLGWIPMETVAFDRSRLRDNERVPHMGWAETTHRGAALFEGIGERPRFYYVHSFHLRCDDPATVMCTARHGYDFEAGVSHGNVTGVQFHPEKSHAFGRQLLTNFAFATVAV